MGHSPSRAVGTIATAATVLIASSVGPAPAGQARGTLGVTVRVVAACGGAVSAGGNATLASGCAPGSAPLAIVTERGSTPSAGPSAPSAVVVESSGELRYVTLIY